MLLDSSNIGMGMAFTAALDEAKKVLWNLGICEKCMHQNKRKCYVHAEMDDTGIKNCKDMREGNAFVFRFWKNCGKRGKYFQEVES